MQRKRKKTLDKLFNNYGGALQDGDEPPPSPNLPAMDNRNSSGRGRSAKRDVSNGYSRGKSTGSTAKKRRTSPNPSKRTSVPKSKSPASSAKRSKSKGRKSVAANGRSNGRQKKAVNASRGNQKKKVAVSTKKKGKKRKKVNSPESVDSDEERDNLWNQQKFGGSVNRKKKKRVAIESDDEDALSDDSNSSGF